MKHRKSVLVVQRRLTHYRVPFFESLRRELASRNIDFVLAYGTPTAAEAGKRDSGELPWAHQVKTTYFLNGRVCWQPFWSLARQSDLVVLTHENKLVCNLAAQYLSRQRVALWGHGANLQGDASSWKEWFKRRTAGQADWWFAYTKMSLPLIQRSGYPGERITVLNNAIDTVDLARQFAAVGPDAIDELRKELGLCGNATGVFLGSLYGDKRIQFLLEAAEALRGRVPGFELVVAGDGPDRALVEAFCKTHDWVRYVGVRSGQRKAELLALARVMLNPGAVGLSILDSFVCRTPMVTTDCGLHGPEFSYLESGANGVVSPDDLQSYVEAVEQVLIDSDYRSLLAAGCARSAAVYTVENMAARFADGIEQCLAAPALRGAA